MNPSAEAARSLRRLLSEEHFFILSLLFLNIRVDSTRHAVQALQEVTETRHSNNCVFSHQELVNLLLCGRAVSNVFDDDVELDSGNGNMTLLKGIKGHCDVGLLSLFEHYNICKVRNTEPLTDHIPV